MAGYVATVNVPGYLPMDDEPSVFATASEAWQYLADERMRDEDDIEPGDAPEDGEAFGEHSPTVDGLVEMAAAGSAAEPGSLWGPTPGRRATDWRDLGLAYSVTFDADAVVADD